MTEETLLYGLHYKVKKATIPKFTKQLMMKIHSLRHKKKETTLITHK